MPSDTDHRHEHAARKGVEHRHGAPRAPWSALASGAAARAARVALAVAVLWLAVGWVLAATAP